MERKYEFTGETKRLESGELLHRIRAVRDFGKIRAGDIGGFIEKENNLSHYGNCWVTDDACVYMNAKVRYNASIRGNSKVYGNACVEGYSAVYGYATVYDNAFIHGYSIISGHSSVCGDPAVYDHAKIRGYSNISGFSSISGNAIIDGNACVCGLSIITDNACVINNARVSHEAVINGSACIGGDARIEKCSKIGGNAKIYGNAIIAIEDGISHPIDGKERLGKDAHITKSSDILTIGPLGSRNGYTTFYRGINNTIMVSCGCFNGTLYEFDMKVKETHGDNDYGKMYNNAIEFASNIFGIRTQKEY